MRSDRGTRGRRPAGRGGERQADESPWTELEHRTPRPRADVSAVTDLEAGSDRNGSHGRHRARTRVRRLAACAAGRGRRATVGTIALRVAADLAPSSAVGRATSARRPTRRRWRPARGTASIRSGVGLGLDLAAAVVLGLGDDPELLGLAGLGEEALGRSRGRCRRPSRRGSSARGGARAGRRPSRCRGTGSSAAARTGAGRPSPRSAKTQRGHATARRTGWRRRSRPSGGCRRASSRGSGSPVGDHAPDVGLGGRDDQGRAPAPADAEEAEPGRVVVGARPQVAEGRLEVAHLVVGDPLERW